MSGKQKQSEPVRKPSRWRIGRKRSTDKVTEVRQPRLEHEFRQGSATSRPPEATSNNHRNHSFSQHDQSLPHPTYATPQKQSSHKKQNKSGKEPPLPPRGMHRETHLHFPQGPYPTHVPFPTQEAGPEALRTEMRREKAMKEMMRSLSMKDDPSKFGSGTLAARRIQREELDAAMARNLFSRDLAISYMSPQVPVMEVQNGHSPVITAVPPASPVNIGPLMHLKPAFTDEQWEAFKRDPLNYIQLHGLPEERNPVKLEVEREVRPSDTSMQQLPDDFSLLPPHLQQAMAQSAPESPTTEEAKLPPRAKGLSPDEVVAILTTFSFYDDDQALSKDKRSRVKGRRLPKGANPRGIISDAEANECAICLVDFEYGDKMGLLPCCHRFHAACIADWLQRDASCPECREDLRDHVQ